MAGYLVALAGKKLRWAATHTFRYRVETDNWRSAEFDTRRHCFDVAWLTIRFEHQTKPDRRWHFAIGLRSEDQTGWYYHGGWAVAGGSKTYCVLGHFNWYFSFSVRPIYKLVYAPSWIKSLARLLGAHPIEIAERYVKEGREIVPAVAQPVAEEAGKQAEEKAT